MYKTEAAEEYGKALRLGQKAYKAALAEGKEPHPAVLDAILGSQGSEVVQDIGLVEIPTEQIVGVKSTGRITAFSADFYPLLDTESEFAGKWIELCAAHLSSGIRDPILCYEYLGKFYVQEGNKRVSVLRCMGAPRVTGQVKRIMPPDSQEPQIRAYYEFLDFYKATGLYQFQFRRPGDYGALLAFAGKKTGDVWQEQEKRMLASYFQYFKEAFDAQGGKHLDLLPEEALLLWLQVYPFADLGRLSDAELKKTVAALWEDVVTLAQPEPVEVRTEPVPIEGKPNVITRLVTGTPDHVNVAFIHPLDLSSSTWAQGHEAGRKYLEEALGDQVTTRSYFHADNSQQAEALIEQAVEEGADLVFTTTPQLSRATLRMALKYPKVRFLNCSVDTSFSSIRTYYSRIYEAKFITGAIAGAMADNDRIGYIGSSPIFGVTASINAFALGAQLTNPRAKIDLGWSCLAGAPQEDFVRNGIQVISNRDMPTQDKKFLNFCNYGTYAQNEAGEMIALASPVWLWGRFYEKVVSAILSGTWNKDKDSPRALNYWWGMDSGVIGVELAEHIPEGLKTLAGMLMQGLQNGTVDPFRRRILSQDGTVINDGSRSLQPDEILHMDWLCENVNGHIPGFDELEDFAKPIVRQLGIYRDTIPAEKEGLV